MWEYKIAFKENKEGGKWGICTVKSNNYLTKSKMERILRKKFKNLENISVLDYSVKEIKKRCKRTKPNTKSFAGSYPLRKTYSYGSVHA